MKKKCICVVLFCSLLLAACGTQTSTGNLSVSEEPVQTTATSPEKPTQTTVTTQTVPEEIVKETKAFIEGPYGSLQLTLPDGWDYEVCETDSEKIVTGGAYGFHIYPADAKEGYVEICYNNLFGVCGTGLEAKHSKLAGDEAAIGYYDGSDIWSYVLYQGKNNRVVAVTEKVESWWQDYEAQVMDILDTLVYDKTNQSGAIGVYDEESQIEEIGAGVSAIKVSDKGATVRFEQYDPQAQCGELITGREFTIEKKTKLGWKAQRIIQKDYAFTEEGIIIDKDKGTQVQYDWEWLYGTLDAGDYRIGVKIIADKSYKVYAHFIIR